MEYRGLISKRGFWSWMIFFTCLQTLQALGQVESPGKLVVAILVAGIISLGVLLTLYPFFLAIAWWEEKLEARRLKEEAARISEAIERSSEVERAAARRALEIEARNREKADWRDADTHELPYRYEIGRHALETLAIRYGIPHLEKDERGRWQEARYISVKKIMPRAEESRFLAELEDYRNRRVDVVIEKGSEYVKTFLPLSENHEKWFSQNDKWEDSIKGNHGFTIKEMARMHFERINRMKSW